MFDTAKQILKDIARWGRKEKRARKGISKLQEEILEKKDLIDKTWTEIDELVQEINDYNANLADSIYVQIKYDRVRNEFEEV